MMMSVTLLVIAVVSYVLGGVNGAIIMSQLVYHEDIRKSGSNNPGQQQPRLYQLQARIRTERRGVVGDAD